MALAQEETLELLKDIARRGEMDATTNIELLRELIAATWEITS
jgi:hypothetical protein